MKRLLPIILALLSVFPGEAAAADGRDTVVRPVLSAYMIEAGSAHVCDTYLTPLHYSGWNTSLSYERMQAMKFDPERWVMRLDGRLSLGATENPAGTATIWQLDFRPSWSMMWRTSLPGGFTLAAGGNIGADIGVLYLSRNGNNPASVRERPPRPATAHIALSACPASCRSILLSRLRRTLLRDISRQSQGARSCSLARQLLQARQPSYS